MPDSRQYPTTPDGRYFVVRGRLWRTSNPALAPEVRQEWVDKLMRARRQVGVAKKAGDREAERSAGQWWMKPSGRWASAGRCGGRTGRRITTGRWWRIRRMRIGMRRYLPRTKSCKSRLAHSALKLKGSSEAKQEQRLILNLEESTIAVSDNQLYCSTVFGCHPYAVVVFCSFSKQSKILLR